MEIIKKECFKCNEILPLSDYYKHPKMSDGRLGKCKSCTKKDSNKREEKLRKDPEWVEKEKIRAREKYHRLYSENENKKLDRDFNVIWMTEKELTKRKTEHIRKYRERFPEKYRAVISSQKIPIDKNYHRHHWSYNAEHWKDIIPLHFTQHAYIHELMVYDERFFMFRRSDSNELLDTKEKHLEYITWCIENKPD